MGFFNSDCGGALFSLAATGPGSAEGGWVLLRLAAVGVGVVLLLLGRRVARPGCAGLGLAMGAVGGLAWSGQAGGGTTMAVIAGAIGGFLIGLVFFKVWVGVVLAVVLAVAVPTASLMWEGVPLPVSGQGQVVRGGSDESASYRERLGVVYEHHAPAVKAWWAELGPITRRTMMITAAFMSVLGLVTGLVYPNHSVSVVLAGVGSLLVLVGLGGLFTLLSPSASQWLPSEGRAAVVTVGLITLVGAVVQWTVLNPKADR